MRLASNSVTTTRSAASLSRRRQTARVPLRLDVGGLRVRRRLANGLGRRPHREHQGRHRDHADARAHAGHHRDDRGDTRPPLRRPRPPRPRDERPAGGRGLARPAVGQAAHPHARVRRDRAHDPPPRGAARAPRRALRHPVHGRRRNRARQAAQDHRPPPPQRGPDLPCGDRPEERRARRRDRGRLAADLLLAGAGARIRRCWRRDSRAAEDGRRTGISRRTSRS